MIFHQQPDEKTYQENKKKSLNELLAEFGCDISWIWIGNASRRKVTFQIDAKNRLGFFAPKSHNLIEINDDSLAEKKISDVIPQLKKFLKNQEENLYNQITATLFDNGLDLVFKARRTINFAQNQALINLAKELDCNISYLANSELEPVLLLRPNQVFINDLKISLASDIFIQATKSGLENIIKLIRNSLTPNAKIADIYSGFGAYCFAIHDLAKSVWAFEGDKKMTDLISKNATANNLSQKIKAEMRDLFFAPLDKKELNNFDCVIINPPRNGAGPQISEIAKSTLKNVIYVSCNPQSFKRDAKILIDSGFRITSLSAIDQFYSTQHLELVSVFKK